MSFTKDNERRIEDNYGNSDFERAKSLTIVFGLKETASPCEADFTVLWRVLLLNTAFARTR